MGNIARTLNDLVKVGTITSIDPKRATARVEFLDLVDRNGKPLISFDYPILNFRTFGVRDYHMPKIGEQVVCLMLGNGIEAGIVLGAIYSDADAPPVDDPAKRHTVFEDGSWFEYDEKAHKLTAHVEGEIDISATGNIAVKSDANITLEAEKNITIKAGGNITAKASRIDLN